MNDDNLAELNSFRKTFPNEDKTYAQVLYRKLLNDTFNISSNKEMLKSTKNSRETVDIIAKLVKQTALKYFTSIAKPELINVFFQELENQRRIKQEKIRQEYIEKGAILWHATPLSINELNGGVLKGNTERPDLVWERVFTGVCAFPNSNGAYALKKAKNEHDFACKGENLVRITDNRLDNKKDDEVLGYIYGHKLIANDGFMPTVSLDGSVAGEWTTEKNVSIDVTKKVTLNSLRENNVHIFTFDKKDNTIIHEMTEGKTIEEQISMFEEFATNSEKVYIDKNGNSHQLKVKDYYNKKYNPSICETIEEKRGIRPKVKASYTPPKIQTNFNIFRNNVQNYNK